MAQAKTILFVDDDPAVHDALRRSLHSQRQTWDLRFASGVDEALDLMKRTAFDAVVTDVTMPHRDGLDLLVELQQAEATRDVPVIILTGLGDLALKRRALELGAVDLITKPVVAEDLVARLRSVLRLKSYEDQLREQNDFLEQKVQSRTQELEQSRMEIIWRLAKAGEYRDEQTGNHVVRVAAYCRALAEQLGLSRSFTHALVLTSPLHDIGKIGVPDAILLKSGTLTEDQWRIMQQHCQIGYEILQKDVSGLADVLQFSGDATEGAGALPPNPLLEHAASIALHHHERWDGTGYPNGLQGEQTPLAARIVAVADVYDALSHARPYKPAFPENKVLAIMTEEAPSHFDPAVFAAFLDAREPFRDIRHTLGEASREAA